MTRIARDSVAPATLGNVGNGPDAGDIDRVVDGQANRDEELGRAYDLLDRVGRDGPPSSRAATNPRAGGWMPTPGEGGVSDALANRRERARLGAPAQAAQQATAKKATAKKAIAKDPTALPPDAECRRSRAAVAAAGFSDVHLRPVPYFNQGNGEWAEHTYPRSPAVPGESRTIKDAGCAPTALAMIDCGLRDTHMRPEAVADFAVQNRVSGRAGVAGTDTAGLARAWAEQNGLGLTVGTSSHQSRNVDVLKAGLEANGIALVSVGVDRASNRGHFTTGSHVMVINGCATRGGQQWFAIANPGRADQADARTHRGLLATDENVTQLGGASNGIGQVWISRTQLEAEMKRCFVFHAGVES